MSERWPDMPDKFYEALGWMHAECCAALDRGEDPRSLEMPDMIKRCISDLARDSDEADPSQTPFPLPEGWQAVPVHPTDDMVMASRWSGCGDVSVGEGWARREVLRRGLAAAPKPPAGGGE